MPYLALRFDASAADAERWADALLAAGALAVDAADANAGTAGETAVYGEPDSVLAAWTTTRLTALFPAGADVPAALSTVSAELGTPPPRHWLEPVADDDWVRRTQEQFVPIRASERLWIVPSWRAPVDPVGINLRIDPGLAFGTGSHATTRLCLRWLDANLRPGAAVLDYGCGSGILAIAAARLGATVVEGVDVDPQAIEASRANAAANAVDARFGVPGSIVRRRFDVVVANILANPLELLAPVLAGRVEVGGAVVLSGVLDSQAPAVAAAYRRWFNIELWGSEDGWVVLAGGRKHDDV